MSTEDLRATIEQAFENRDHLDAHAEPAIHEVIGMLDRGELRVAEEIDGAWVTHTWVNGKLAYKHGLFNEMVRGERLEFERTH